MTTENKRKRLCSEVDDIYNKQVEELIIDIYKNTIEKEIKDMGMTKQRKMDKLKNLCKQGKPNRDVIDKLYDEHIDQVTEAIHLSKHLRDAGVTKARLVEELEELVTDYNEIVNE